MNKLFTPLTLREVTFRNRIGVAPMCQYSSDDGFANSWHMVHLGSRAVGGAGLVMTEAAAISPEGRISSQDLGLWSEAHASALAPIVTFIEAQGARAGVQLAHSGRKGSVKVPWLGNTPVSEVDGGWRPIGPSAIRYGEKYSTPIEMTLNEISDVVDRFGEAARLANIAGFSFIECHMAHGYLLHSFLSPLSNRRDDAYGGSLENRMRFPLDVASRVREMWPRHMPMFVRISATDWVENGWDADQSAIFACRLAEIGVDLIDCSSGGIVADEKPAQSPGFQVPFAARIRNESGLATAAVGLITTPQQAEDVLSADMADIILMGRAMLRDPYWPIRAAEALGQDTLCPIRYRRAAPFHACDR
jgi:2,4-dienoyl-CoA reductase-like NADH-dependent reductase (Old Yellow Enzyme family)